MAILISILLLLAAVALIAGNLLEQRRRQRMVSQRLQGHLTREDKLGSLMRQLGASQVAQRSVSLDNETQTLLNRVGWRKANQRSMFAACQVGVPIVLLGLTLLGQQLLFPMPARRGSRRRWPWGLVTCCPSASWPSAPNIARNALLGKSPRSFHCCASCSNPAWRLSNHCEC